MGFLSDSMNIDHAVGRAAQRDDNKPVCGSTDPNKRSLVNQQLSNRFAAQFLEGSVANHPQSHARREVMPPSPARTADLIRHLILSPAADAEGLRLFPDAAHAGQAACVWSILAAYPYTSVARANSTEAQRPRPESCPCGSEMGPSPGMTDSTHPTRI